MERIYTYLALHGSKNKCDRTNNVFFPISEVCGDTVSLGSGGNCFSDRTACYPCIFTVLYRRDTRGVKEVLQGHTINLLRVLQGCYSSGV